MGNKTMKRELAFAFAVLLFLMVVKVFFFMPAEDVSEYKDLLIGLSWPILSFVAAAAGIHTLTQKAPTS